MNKKFLLITISFIIILTGCGQNDKINKSKEERFMETVKKEKKIGILTETEVMKYSKIGESYKVEEVPTYREEYSPEEDISKPEDIFDDIISSVTIYTPQSFTMIAANQLKSNYMDINFDSVKEKIIENEGLKLMDKLVASIYYYSDKIVSKDTKAHMVIKKYNQENKEEVIQANEQEEGSMTGDVISLGIYFHRHVAIFDYEKILNDNPKKLDVVFIVNGKEFVKEINLEELKRINKI